MCQKIKSSIVEKQTQDIYGNQLRFCTITHGCMSNCKEYIIHKEAFNFKRWVVFMTIFSSLAFYCKFYNTDVSFLGLFLCFLCVILVLKLHHKVKQESLLVIASLGLQLTTTFVTGRKASQFILQRDIQDVVINEGIFMHRVLFYLAVLLRDVKDPTNLKCLIPLFKYTFPRLDCLESIYNGIQASLFLNQTESSS
ncbi:Phosphatidylinositol N-acetylglucosaminyltransferase subunit H, partial [Stegodyphus mimosarum]